MPTTELKIVKRANAGQNMSVTEATLVDGKEVSRATYFVNGRGPAAEAKLLDIIAKDKKITAPTKAPDKAPAGAAAAASAAPVAIPTVAELMANGMTQEVADLTVKTLTDQAAAAAAAGGQG